MKAVLYQKGKLVSKPCFVSHHTLVGFLANKNVGTWRKIRFPADWKRKLWDFILPKISWDVYFLL